MKLDYSSNNSGGRWWLKDEDWLALERAGWVIDWYADRSIEGRGYNPYSDGRFLDALAGGAHKIVENREEANEALSEFERLTGSNIDDEGCNCCGKPHYFTLYNQIDCVHCDEYTNECVYCSGTGIDDEYVDSFDSAPVKYERKYF